MSLEIVALIIAVITLIGTIIWNSINTILNILNHRRSNMLNKLPTKKRFFVKLYEMAKDITERMIFTETEEQENTIIYNFSIQRDNKDGFLELNQQRVLLERLNDMYQDLHYLCGMRIVNKDGIESIREPLKSFILHINKISVPIDLRPNNPEEIKTRIINDIKTYAEENGVKLK